MNIDSKTLRGACLKPGATSWRRLSKVAGATAIVALALMTGCKSRQAAAPTDQQLSSSIQAKIHGQAALANQNIQVSVSNGVATLSGTVTDPASRALAGQDSGSIPGVKTVVNNLSVQPAQQAADEPPAAAPAPASAREARPESRRHDQHDQPDRSSARRPSYAPPQQQQASAPPPSEPMQSAAAPAQPAAPALPPQPVVQRVTLQTGTVIPVILTEALDSKTAQPDDTFHATLASDIVSDGVVAIPRGAPVLGQVVDAKAAAHFKGRSLLSIDLTEVTVHGRKIGLETDSFSKEGTARGKNTAEKSGGGALLGALIGGLAGGGKGAAIGAIAGGGAGAGVNAVTHGQEVQLAPESRVDFHLQAPITVTVTTPPPGSPANPVNPEPTLQQR